jgi:hypothetical protein
MKVIKKTMILIRVFKTDIDFDKNDNDTDKPPSSRRMAAFLEENELFVPEDDDGDDD